ncbi:sulfite exporter TauE/SafE family protein [Methyloligella sp. 2.7D]|uniref:sulfite exporter TauE/SafE family protein n=1 Tax=unclassified Methyloligella TaxID=2625955 RepID=UPI00157C92CA|nr:sulfite exporter TauE/SafE family protein [Methyloligella sp. GL2]QKP76130.1 sulfite exporter TauE/SafE family protein [Methyloligella sp. GL2]
MLTGNLLAIGCGALVGFALGLIGGGGSILATPLLLYVVGIEQTHVAIGTSALAVSVNAYANLISHARAGHVWWRCAIVFAIVGSLGALLGSSLGKAVDGQQLLFLFGILMVVVGVLMLRPRTACAPGERNANLKTCVTTGALALLAGAGSGFFGVGGGFLIVPCLIAATRMPTINAVGSSLLAVGTFGLVTAINYARSGLIDWPVTAEFIAGGILGGLAGMMLAKRLSGEKDYLNKIFSVVIFAVAAYILYRSRGAFLG